MKQKNAGPVPRGVVAAFPSAITRTGPAPFNELMGGGGPSLNGWPWSKGTSRAVTSPGNAMQCRCNSGASDSPERRATSMGLDDRLPKTDPLNVQRAARTEAIHAVTGGERPALNNDCGGVDSETHALERLGVKHSAVPIGSREDGERISMRPTSLEQNPSRCNSGPQSPFNSPKSEKARPTGQGEPFNALGADGKAWLRPPEAYEPNGSRRVPSAPFPPELTALCLALIGPVVCVAVMSVMQG